MKIRKSRIEKVYNIGPRDQSYKTFYSRNLRISVIGWSVCLARLEKLAKDKHWLITETRKLRTIKFYNIGPVGPMLQKNLWAYFTKFRNKLACLSLKILFSLVQCL
jgi:hypothetical protein